MKYQDFHDDIQREAAAVLASAMLVMPRASRGMIDLSLSARTRLLVNELGDREVARLLNTSVATIHRVCAGLPSSRPMIMALHDGCDAIDATRQRLAANAAAVDVDALANAGEAVSR